MRPDRSMINMLSHPDVHRSGEGVCSTLSGYWYGNDFSAGVPAALS